MTRILIETEIGIVQIHPYAVETSPTERLVLRKLIEEARALLKQHNRSTEGAKT